MDIDFNLQYVAMTRYASFERAVGLYPLVGYPNLGNDVVGPQNDEARQRRLQDYVWLGTQKLIEQRRARLSSLTSRGWRLSSAVAAQAARNCRPAFVGVTPCTYRCSLWFCPFCHARWAGSYLDRVLRAVPAADPQTLAFPYHLIEYVRIKRLPYQPSHGNLTERAWLQQILDYLPYRRAELLYPLAIPGAMSYSFVSPGRYSWVIKQRFLLLVPPDFQIPAAFAMTDGRCMTRRHEQPTSRVVRDALIRFFHYPVGWLRSRDPDPMRWLLDERAANGRRRLFATYGVFRGGGGC